MQQQNAQIKFRGGGGIHETGTYELVSLHLRPSPIQQLAIKFFLIQSQAIKLMLLSKIMHRGHNVYGNERFEVQAKVS